MNELRSISETLAREGTRAIEQARELTENALARGRKSLEELSEKTEDVWKEARHRSQKSWRDARALLLKHPGKALGLAFFSGIVAGYFLIGARQRKDIS